MVDYGQRNLKGGGQMLNTRVVKSRMTLLGLTQPEVANAMGINTATFNKKVNGTSRLYLDEYFKLCEILQLYTEEERKALIVAS